MTDSKSPPAADGKPPAFIHVDCDGLWAVAACYGEAPPTPPEGDPFWVEGIPAALDLFTPLKIPATFFVISRDLSTPAHRDLLQRLVDADHEIANHTHTHRMDLRSCDHAALRAEIEPACARIEEAAGRPPLGFRAPGFSFHPNLPEILTELGHIYDSSLLPSPWAPALRLARRVMGGGGGQRQRPYGSFGQSFSPRGPHSVKRGRGEIVEIPVSLTPGLRLPAHASFALLRSDDAFRRTVEWHAQRRTAFVWVIHLIDLCDTLAIELPTPGWSRSLFRRAADEKRRRIGEMLRVIAGEFEIQRTDRWVQSEVHRI